MSSSTTTICAFCHVALDLDGSTACEACGTRHHMDCWEQNEGCAVPLCEGGPKLPYIAPTPAPGDVVAVDGDRRIIEIDGNGELVAGRTPLPGARHAVTRRRMAVIAGAAAVLVATAVIVARGASSSTNAVGTGAVPVEVHGTPPAAVPAPRLTLHRIAVEEARVRRYSTAARQAGAAAAARRRAATPTVVVNRPVAPVQQTTTPAAPVIRPTAPAPKPSQPHLVTAKPVTGNFG
jgi:hypothetical protein